MLRFTAKLLGIMLLVGTIVAPQSYAQAPPDMPVQPAPSAKDRRATPRTERTSSEAQKDTNRIVGGRLSMGRPFVVALLYEKDGSLFQYCGASVIGNRWLLTAAHCKVQKGEWAIVNRSDLASSGGMRLRISNVHQHPDYNPQTNDNDVTLLYLSGEISSAIPRVNIVSPPKPGTRVLVAGWGLTSEGGKPSLRLREVDPPVVNNSECKKKYASLTDNMICAGEANKDSCQGDSGGPLFLVNGTDVQQFGVTSYGVGCGKKGWPGVYSRVERYQTWIEKVMSE